MRESQVALMAGIAARGVRSWRIASIWWRDVQVLVKVGGAVKRYAMDPCWRALLARLGVRPASILRQADLPEDLFSRARPALATEELSRLFGVLEAASADEPAGLSLGLVAVDPAHPPVFAAFCSGNLAAAAIRFAEYRATFGPIVCQAHAMAGGLELTVEPVPDWNAPAGLIAAELVQLVSLARRASGQNIRPVAVEMTLPPPHREYREFFGHPVLEGPFNRVVFAPRDAKRAFPPPAPEVFAHHPPDLRPRLDQLEPEAEIAARVRAVLTEILPAGQTDIGAVAKRLGTSGRTLQRRLGGEGTAFQEVLSDTRERLARDYLRRTQLMSGEIAFLLGYDDPNSFTRAFHGWTGMTPETCRKQASA